MGEVGVGGGGGTGRAWTDTAGLCWEERASSTLTLRAVGVWRLCWHSTECRALCLSVACTWRRWG